MTWKLLVLAGEKPAHNVYFLFLKVLKYSFGIGSETQASNYH